MSLAPRPVPDVPEQTALIARSAFPKGHPYLMLRDELGSIFTDEDFIDLFPSRGQPAYSPWRLALITIMQFREKLTDRQAADAVRARIDWKYMLGLELTDSGFDFSVLSEFRDRLIDGSSEELLLDKLLARFKELGVLKGRGNQRMDSTRVLSAVRELSRLELVIETMRATLNELADVSPEWLKRVAPQHWYKRYGSPAYNVRLPQSNKERKAYMKEVGKDGFELLRLLEKAPKEAQTLAIVAHMRSVWQWQFRQGKPPDKQASNEVSLNENPGKAGLRPDSPYDHDIRYANKGRGAWVGYALQLSETCDEGLPQLIVHVLTTPASTHDSHAVPVMHGALEKKGLLPEKHLVDSHYAVAKRIVAARNDYSVALIGTTMTTSSQQSRNREGFGTDDFTIDWAAKEVWCPQGKKSEAWGEYETKRMGRFVRIRFAKEDCEACPVRRKCTTGTRPRQLTFKRKEDYDVLQEMRSYMSSEQGKIFYNLRSGIEGTIAKGVRGYGMRKTRYRGLKKTHLGHVATAAAMNLDRYIDYRMERKKSKIRVSRFAALAPRT